MVDNHRRTPTVDSPVESRQNSPLIASITNNPQARSVKRDPIRLPSWLSSVCKKYLAGTAHKFSLSIGLPALHRHGSVFCQR